MLCRRWGHWHSMREQRCRTWLFQPEDTQAHAVIRKQSITRIGANVHRMFDVTVSIACRCIYLSSFSRTCVTERMKAISHAYSLTTRIPLSISFIILIRWSFSFICLDYVDEVQRCEIRSVHGDEPTVNAFWTRFRYKLAGIKISNKTMPGTTDHCICW